MEPQASALGGLLAGLPALGRFLLLAAPALLVVSGGLFSLRRAPAMVRVRASLDSLLGILLAVILLAMVFLSGLQILLRNVFDSGLLWIDPLLRHLVLLLAFTGAIAATGTKRHVQINALGRLLRGNARRVGGAVVAAAAGLICVALTHASLELLRDEIEFPEVLFLGISSWVVMAIFPAAFAVLAFRFDWLLFAEIAGEAPAPPEGEIDVPECNHEDR